MKSIIYSSWLFLFPYFVVAQIHDTIISKNADIEQVVISTQIEPRSVKNSINNVRVISKTDIKNLGAVHLGDVLNQYINITVIPDGISGRSTVNLFGLDASYFKILIDNVPLVNESGFGNNIDLSQINLNDIERIEIIEGAMGVTHGANAVSGILNIITKKNTYNNMEINLSAQEETVGKEYNFINKGRHIQSVNLLKNINNNWYVTLGTNLNNFKGYYGGYKGKNYLFNDRTRGYKWLPKENINSKAVVNYNKDNFNIFYRFEYMTEKVNSYSNTVKSGYNTSLGAYKYADDTRYHINRIYNNLGAIGKTNWFNYDLSLSYQSQSRNQELYKYYIKEQRETDNQHRKLESMQVWYSTGTFNKIWKDKNLNFQLGYELVNNKGFSLTDEANNQEKEVTKHLNNYDIFAVSEFKLFPRLAFRPGFRYSIQNLFPNQYAYSIGANYLSEKEFEYRLALGKSYRTPSFIELYNKMIFEGHYFVGNENLIPEEAHSVEGSFRKSFFSEKNPDISLTSSITCSFYHIKDRITDALIGFDGNIPKYEMINISKYQSINFSTNNRFTTKDWKYTIGASFSWISQLIDNNVYTTDNRFLFNLQLNTNITYTVPRTKTIISAYYKFKGVSQRWTATLSGYSIASIEPYGWLDASVQQNFLKGRLEASLGIRNALNVVEVTRSITDVQTNHLISTDIVLGYGRSYYLKLIYKLNI
ncbi:MAG: TonB-dependent receptor [Bacteroidota bacterium]|nr:TonB-dependent receptor [Bacteroidota bacterium]